MRRAGLIWGALCVLIVLPLGLAAQSPLLAWRDPIYILAGFAGIVGLCLMLLQPLLAAGLLPGLRRYQSRRIHVWTGLALLFAVLTHIAGLWITSPPDVIDVLLLRSPTPFSHWGVIALWSLLLAASLALLRQHLPARLWRLGHWGLVLIALTSTIAHALLVEGTMETTSKVILSLACLTALAKAAYDLRAWKRR